MSRRQLEGYRFRRQYGIGPYILDFCCPAVGLAIELDGAVHDSPAAQQYDAARTDALAAAGLRVLRFENRRVFEDLEGVLAEIAAVCGAPPPDESPIAALRGDSSVPLRPEGNRFGGRGER